MSENNTTIKRDCYAFLDNEKPSCGVLTELVCAKRTCSFYTNKDEHASTARLAQERNKRVFPHGYTPRNKGRQE